MLAHLLVCLCIEQHLKDAAIVFMGSEISQEDLVRALFLCDLCVSDIGAAT